MKIPFDAEIAKEKVTKYLLTKRDESDKSLYLTSAGYTIDEYEQLVEDLRNQILSSVLLCFMERSMAKR